MNSNDLSFKNDEDGVQDPAMDAMYEPNEVRRIEMSSFARV